VNHVATYQEIKDEYERTGREKKQRECKAKSEVVLGLIEFEGLGGA